MGIDGTQEGEEHDRSNCTLPGLQPKLVETIASLNKPTVMVLIHGGAMCLGSLKGTVPAIVDAFYGGERAADALAAVLFAAYNPSGKLPVTMYPPEYLHQIPITQMSVTAPPGRTHLYYTGTPEFAFGAGLSYSRWVIQVTEADQEFTSNGGSARFSIRLTNEGPFGGRQRVLAFVRPRDQPAHQAVPRQRLWGYTGAELSVGESTTLSFVLRASTLAQSNEFGDRVVEPGAYEVAFSEGSYEVRTALRVTGDTQVVEASVFKSAKVASKIVI